VRENVVTILGRLVAGETRLMQGLITGFSILEVAEPPAAGRGTGILPIFDATAR
jgi:hypothetical protein